VSGELDLFGTAPEERRTLGSHQCAVAGSDVWLTRTMPREGVHLVLELTTDEVEALRELLALELPDTIQREAI
jgi:hypothetical protein